MPQSATFWPMPAAPPQVDSPVASASTAERIELSPDHWAVVARSDTQAAVLNADWSDLAIAAATANVFYESWMLLPAWRAFGGLTDLIAVYRRGNSPAEPPVMLGLFPMVIGDRESTILGPVASLWTHPYGFSRTPLLRRGASLEAIDLLSRALGKIAPRIGLCVWERCHDEGPVAQGLCDWRRRRGSFELVTQRYNRAVLRVEPGRDADQYAERAISKKQRRELARQTRRLGDLGTVRITRPPVDEFLDIFLTLEAAGWKKDSAVAADARHEGYLREIAAAADDRFDGSVLWLDDRPIAAKLNFLSSGPVASRTAFAWKIGYDETLSKFSPGVLLELDTIEAMHGTGTPNTIDSCALPDHPMIDRLWSERLAVAHRVFSLPHASRVARLRLMALGWRMRLIRRDRGPEQVLRSNY